MTSSVNLSAVLIYLSVQEENSSSNTLIIRDKIPVFIVFSQLIVTYWFTHLIRNLSFEFLVCLLGIYLSSHLTLGYLLSCKNKLHIYCTLLSARGNCSERWFPVEKRRICSRSCIIFVVYVVIVDCFMSICYLLDCCIY